jgi:hypothetical protein
MRVTQGRIDTIRKFQGLVDNDAREVPTLHKFFKEFPWLLNPTWMTWRDEVTYEKLLREHFLESNLDEVNRRIDFICNGYDGVLNIVELKRPSHKANKESLDQLEAYVDFIKGNYLGSSEHAYSDVRGYLVTGGIVQTPELRSRVERSKNAGIFVRLYTELLSNAHHLFEEAMAKYEKLHPRMASMAGQD